MDAVEFPTLGLLGLAILVALVARRFRMPYTVGLVLAGGALATARSNVGLALTHDFIVDLILPPLIFEAALNLRWRELARDYAPVLALATIGVAISGAVVALALVSLLHWSVAAAMIFGALIAATDPIAVIALLRETGIKGRLRLLIEAESLINDGVAAVLFTVALAWAKSGPGASQDAASMALALVEIAGGGIGVGLAVGLAAIALAGRTDDRLVETALTVLAAFSSLLVAERFHVSGVLACGAAGITMGNLGVLGPPDEDWPAVFTPHGRAFALEFWEFAAFIANSLVFLTIGLAIAGISFRAIGFASLAVVVVATLAGRALTVYPISFAFSRSRWAIPMNQQHLLWWGGLRGALSLALALALPESFPGRDGVIVAAFACVAFSVVVQGLSAPLLLRWLGLRPRPGGEAAR
jgi:CPA1 family monovalent cation:H+ antiporter